MTARIRPLIGITLDAEPPGGYSKYPWYALRSNYAGAVAACGGLPIALPHDPALTSAYLDRIDALVVTGGAFDLDTPLSQGSYEAALHAAGGACALVESLASGGERVGISALRPPGHHCERARAMGFCLFANVSVAARHSLDSLGVGRLLARPTATLSLEAQQRRELKQKMFGD